ncbi:hypothetical protein HFP15_08345 [Amycolatopsis sp. K13G38]|uniref:Uncharacterized protein n=1 Tax=Amycolatopsis acididurans TaxID=2724524 RepID=A0ABX1IZD0_9PSEU|nr:hypothetical protein [Amycolatopsis acididurans]NKQ52890.1 hypothetical protein [Amycolatopsis acididurans]
MIYIDRTSGPAGVIHLRIGTVTDGSIQDVDGSNWIPIEDAATPGEAILVADKNIIKDAPPQDEPNRHHSGQRPKTRNSSEWHGRHRRTP